MTISTRRFCGSRTPSAVGTKRPFSPMPITVMACAGTPLRTKASLTALARRSDSAILYASGPDVSVWPVAVMRALPLALKASDACLMELSAWADRFDRSQSKNTLNDGGATAGGGGGGGGGADPKRSCKPSMMLKLLFDQVEPLTCGLDVP